MTAKIPAETVYGPLLERALVGRFDDRKAAVLELAATAWKRGWDECQETLQEILTEQGQAAMTVEWLAEALYLAGVSVPAHRGSAEWYADIAGTIARRWLAAAGRPTPAPEAPTAATGPRDGSDGGGR